MHRVASVRYCRNAGESGHFCKAKLTSLTLSHAHLLAFMSLCRLSSACECTEHGFAHKGVESTFGHRLSRTGCAYLHEIEGEGKAAKRKYMIFHKLASVWSSMQNAYMYIWGIKFILSCILCFLWKCLCSKNTFNLLSVLFRLVFHYLTYFTTHMTLNQMALCQKYTQTLCTQTHMHTHFALYYCFITLFLSSLLPHSLHTSHTHCLDLHLQICLQTSLTETVIQTLCNSSDQPHSVQHWRSCKLGWEIIIGGLNMAAILICFI